MKNINKEKLVNPHNFYTYFYPIDKIDFLKDKCKNKTVFFVYFLKKKYIKTVFNKFEFKLIDSVSNLYQSDLIENLFICISKTGSPAVSIQIENLIYLGFENIIHIGLAGSFSQSINIGDFVVSNGAYSESIIPYIYLKNKICYFPDKNDKSWFLNTIIKTDTILTNKIEKNLKKNNIYFKNSIIFSTDLLYKESGEKFNNLINKNSFIIDMEAATIYAIARAYNKKASGFYIISDEINNNSWNVAFNSDLLKKKYSILCKLLKNFEF